MRKHDDFITNDLKHIEDRAQDLILYTLKSLKSDIDILATRIVPDNPHPPAAIGYCATILMKTLDGNTLRSEARDCDEMLAVYKALAKIIDQVPMIEASVDDDSSGRV